MKNPTKIRNAMLVAALAAVTATAWATSETLSDLANESYVTKYRPVWTEVEREAATPGQPVAVSETLAPNESVVTPNDPDVAPGTETTTAAPRMERPAPVAERRVAAEPPITIEERRLSPDERIQADVMDRIASMPNVSGKIGVESREAVVTLTGYTGTAGQAYRVGREARGIVGVREVQNQIRPRIGGSV